MDSIFAERRERLTAALGPRAALLVAALPGRPAGGRACVPHADSDVFYLTGFTEPVAAVLIRPGHEAPFVMFVRPRNPAEEVWTGRRAGVEGATGTFGAAAAFSFDEIDARLPELIAGREEVHYLFGRDEELDRLVLRAVNRTRAGERKGTLAPLRLVDARLLLHEMRLFKSPGEVQAMRRAAAITAEAHLAAMRAVAPGMGEFELEAIINHQFRSRGATGPSYATIVGGGVNATVLHYEANADRLADGTLVLVDAGCEVDGYAADVTRTYPVGGRFGDAQRRLYQAVLDAEQAAIAAVRPGVTVDDVHAVAVERLTAAMVEVGLLQGEPAELVAKEAYKPFYMHRTSHWLGLDVHDVGFYSHAGSSRPLEPGMVLTIEPGLYVAAEAAAPDAFRGIGIRIEDDVLVTDHGCEVLTAAIPRTVEELEQIVGSAKR